MQIKHLIKFLKNFDKNHHIFIKDGAGFSPVEWAMQVGHKESDAKGLIFGCGERLESDKAVNDEVAILEGSLITEEA